MNGGEQALHGLAPKLNGLGCLSINLFTSMSIFLSNFFFLRMNYSQRKTECRQNVLPFGRTKKLVDIHSEAKFSNNLQYEKHKKNIVDD